MEFDYIYASKIERNTLYSNDGYAIDAENDSNLPADANIYTYNNCYDLYYGIYIYEDFPTITYNTVKNVQGCEPGIQVDCYNGGCVGGVVAYNSVSNIACDYDCYDIDHDGMAIQNNTAELCSNYGFDVDGNSNIIMNNKSKYAGYGDGYSGFYVSGYGNTLTGNTAEYSGYAGFEIYSNGGTNTLTGNTAQYNTWAGIYVNNAACAGSTTVQNNKVLNNDGEGIVNSDCAGNTTMNNNTSKGNRLDICNDDNLTPFASFLGNIFVTGGQTTACVLN